MEINNPGLISVYFSCLQINICSIVYRKQGWYNAGTEDPLNKHPGDDPYANE